MIDNWFVPPSGKLEDWVEALPQYQRSTISLMLNTEDPEDTAIAWLSASGPASTIPLGASSKYAKIFYGNVLLELQKLLCRADPEYSEARASLLSQAKAGRAALITLAATTIAPALGVPAALVAPPVAIILALSGAAGNATVCQWLVDAIDRHPVDRRDVGATPPAE